MLDDSYCLSQVAQFSCTCVVRGSLSSALQQYSRTSLTLFVKRHRILFQSILKVQKKFIQSQNCSNVPTGYSPIRRTKVLIIRNIPISHSNTLGRFYMADKDALTALSFSVVRGSFQADSVAGVDWVSTLRLSSDTLRSCAAILSSHVLCRPATGTLRTRSSESVNRCFPPT